ncbi:S8 family serine peptidase [Methanogenium organophilum]|uniref:S8 family serine peptidase n=1 Tax=Methanogenium organophilum TaxID=2199 RepID=A0A9X9S386_METOG|nr:S8 family serine peptidase [Methanogenium organophilum]WAI00690.1 S8 family serine peptidase [Methanogenium organophilum]
MESLVKKSIFLSITLFVLIAGASAAQFDDDGVDKFAIVNPPEEGGGERIPVFLVMSDQPTATTSVQTMKATAASEQYAAMSALAGIDSYAAEAAQSYWLVNAIRVEAYPADLDRLASLPGVDHIERDFTVTVADPTVETMNEVSPDYIVASKDEGGVVWSADFIDAPTVWDTGNIGAGVNISIIDTGIDGGHPAFGDRIVAWADFVGDGLTPYDDNGHGTHCAGTSAGGVVETTYGGDTIDVTLGVAPGANLMGAKVLNAAGSGDFSVILEGAQWSVVNGADVISMSLGGFLGPWQDDFSSEKIVGTLNASSSAEVFIEAAPSYNTNWEPQFIVGAVYAESSAIDEIVSGGNLTFVVTDATDGTATGSVIDWLGFDTPSNIYYFKAPYADNAGAWTGNWKATLTNNGNESIDIDKIRMAVCYQSNGQDIASDTLNNLMEQGVTVVVSAGNSGEYGLGTIGTPGTAEDVITVGATDYMMDYRASFSSMGPVGSLSPYIKPDVVAPGVGIISSYKDGGYAIMDGTSMSTPAVAGAAALMLAGNSSLSSADVKDALMSSAVHLDENGLVLDTMVMNSAYGAGRVDAYEAVNITDGLGGTPAGDGVIYEFFGGILSESSVYGDVLPVTAVAWNVTGGVPMAGEEIEFSVRNYDLPYVFVNSTEVTDSSGNVLTSLDISGYDADSYVELSIAWNEHVIKQGFYKQVLPEESVVGDFIFSSQWYTATPDDTVQIKYPLLDPDGAPYTDNVTLIIGNYSTDIYSETISPVAGVVSTDVNLGALTGVAEDTYDITIDTVDVGSLEVASEEYIWYELSFYPDTAICSPGSSLDISTVITSGHHGNSASTTATATVVTFSEAEINSLTTETRNSILGGEVTSLDELRSDIQGMGVNEFSETFPMANGIGVYSLDMPADAYLAMVYVTTPLTGVEPTNAALVYGEITPWIRHSTTESSFEIPFGEMTSIRKTSSDWSATWDQETYSSIPASEASLGFTVYSYTFDESANEYVVTPAADRLVYLYTPDGVMNATTAADGTCGFTLTPGETGDLGYEYLAVTDGLYVSDDTYEGAYPFDYPTLYSRISADLITLEPSAPSYRSYIIPDTASREISVDAEGDTRTITITSTGPDDESIQEKGMFTFDKLGEYFSSEGTFDASTVQFDGTVSKSVVVPENGSYDAEFILLNPVEGSIHYTGTTFADTSYDLTYQIMDDVLQGTSVPVTFTLTDHDGNPVTGAKVLLGLGAAGGSLYPYGIYRDARYENVNTYLGDYPDPYSQVDTGYTDASGQVTLTFTAPTSAEQANRLDLGIHSSVNYQIICIHNDRLIATEYDCFMPVAGELPDFVPSVDAPHVVKINRDDTVKVNDLSVLVTNVGTADFVYSSSPVKLTAVVGSYSSPTEYPYDILKGETEEVLYLNVDESAETYGIDPGTTSLPQDKIVEVTVNPERTIDELRYDNNVYNHNLRITAPDLVTEIIAPTTTTQFGETPIGVKVTNAGEVPSVATTLNYIITGSPAESGIAIAALGPGNSTTIWKNETLTVGEYTITAEVNPGHVTDYETSYANNGDTRELTSYAHAPASIVLPPAEVLIPGSQIELPIVVENVTGLAAFQMNFSYNASVIEVTDVLSGDVGGFIGNLDHAQEGYVIFNGAQMSSESGDVTVATLVIDVSGSSGDETPLELSAELWDINEFTIPVTVTDGSATLLLYGDANDDGFVNQADTLKVLKWVVGIDADKPTFGTRLLQTDVTENSLVDVGDAMFIAQKNAELRDDYFNIIP